MGRDAGSEEAWARAQNGWLPLGGAERVDRLSREGDRYVVAAGDRRFEAAHVVVSSGAYQRPRVPAFASDLDPGVLQPHSGRYRDPSQLRKGGVLVVGAANVIWCTGFVPDFGWIGLPVFAADGGPVHDQGIVESEPGLYFLGLVFQYALSSSLVSGVGRDAAHIARHIAERIAPPSPTTTTRSVAPASSC